MFSSDSIVQRCRSRFSRKGTERHRRTHREQRSTCRSPSSRRGSNGGACLSLAQRCTASANGSVLNTKFRCAPPSRESEWLYGKHTCTLIFDPHTHVRARTQRDMPLTLVVVPWAHVHTDRFACAARSAQSARRPPADAGPKIQPNQHCPAHYMRNRSTHCILHIVWMSTHMHVQTLHITNIHR